MWNQDFQALDIDYFKERKKQTTTTNKETNKQTKKKN